MSVHRLADGRWVVRYRAGTVAEAPTRTAEYFGRGDDAEQAARQRNAALGFGQVADHSGPTVADVAAGYVMARGGLQARSTVKNHVWKLDNTILPVLGRMPAARLGPQELDRYVAARMAAGRKKGTVRRELTILRAMLRWAVRARLLSVNPMADYPFPSPDTAVIQPPSQAELAALYAAAAPHLQRAILLGYYTGMRPGPSELLAARWEHVDLHGQTLFVPGAAKGGPAGRIIPLADPLAAVLPDWLAEDRAAGTVEYLVHYHGRPVRSIKVAWARALHRAGIARRIRPYDLRHLAATTLLDAGGDLKSVSEILGHASPNQTMATYQHTSAALRRATVARFGTVVPEWAQKTAAEPDV